MEKKTRIWTKWLYWFKFAITVIFVYKTVPIIFDTINRGYTFTGHVFQYTLLND